MAWSRAAPPSAAHPLPETPTGWLNHEAFMLSSVTMTAAAVAGRKSSRGWGGWGRAGWEVRNMLPEHQPGWGTGKCTSGPDSATVVRKGLGCTACWLLMARRGSILIIPCKSSTGAIVTRASPYTAIQEQRYGSQINCTHKQVRRLRVWPMQGSGCRWRFLLHSSKQYDQGHGHTTLHIILIADCDNCVFKRQSEGSFGEKL